MGKRDGISGLSFLQALDPFNRATGAAYNGDTIDMQGYNQVAFIVQVGSALAGSLAAWTGDWWNIIIEHGTASAAGVDQWSIVTAVNVLDSVIGSGGAYSATTSGIVYSIASTELNTVKVVGYLGDASHRYVRLRLSETGAASVTFIGAVAVLGRGGQWPVIEPVGH